MTGSTDFIFLTGLILKNRVSLLLSIDSIDSIDWKEKHPHPHTHMRARTSMSVQEDMVATLASQTAKAICPRLASCPYIRIRYGLWDEFFSSTA